MFQNNHKLTPVILYYTYDVIHIFTVKLNGSTSETYAMNVDRSMVTMYIGNSL